jgi:4-carboxymuconolactone decarboxylase
MARIELITSKDQIPAERHQEYDEIIGVLGNVGGPFGVLMYSPGLAERVCKTGAHVRLESSLTMVERELCILSLCREKDASFEWGGHVNVARKAGMREEAIEVMKTGGDPSGLEDDERDIITYSRQLLRNNKVEDDLFNSMLARHDIRWMVEITATLGQYSYIACINNAFNMEREGGETLPPRK